MMIAMTRISLKDLIAPSFYSVHNALKREQYTHYWLKGGRGSTKSSFVSLEIILGMMQDPLANAVVLRKVGQYLKDSVFEQLSWAIDKLGVSQFWHTTKNPMEMTYIPTGQKILFRGADSPRKIKSTKFSKGYAKYIWFEEVDEFHGMEEIRIINQSLMRGGERFVVFYSFNPPASVRNWVNAEVLIDRADRLVHHSTYLDVPKEWLGEPFIIEAEHLKKTNERAYKHEYLGEVTGTGGEVFTNVTIRDIPDDEIARFDRIKRGLDFGYASDPLHYGVCHFDKTRRRLYIFHEVHKVGLSNRAAVDLIKQENVNNEPIVADSAEPRTINEFRNLGLKIVGAKKGPGSVEHGIKFLQDLEEIIIDKKRCPNTAREFLHYELEKDREGNFKADYPDKNNHSIDAVRYALEDDMIYARSRVRKKPLGF
jgi:phage terminase large subunit